MGDVDGVPVPVDDSLELGVSVCDTVGDCDVVVDAVGVPLAVPPMLSVVVGVAVTVDERLCVVDDVSDPVGVCDGVIDDVPVPLPVVVDVGVTERLGVGVVLLVPVSEPVELALAPLVTLPVGVRETDRESERVDVGESDDVGVTVDVPVPVVVTLLVVLAVWEGVSDPLGVLLGDAPCVTEGVGVFEIDSERVGVVLTGGVGVLEIDSERVGVVLPV